MLESSAKGWHYSAFLLAFVLLAILGFQSKRTQEALLETNRSVTYSLEIITSVQSTLSSLQDIETGSHGSIITGDPEYLKPYSQGLAQLEQHRRTLEFQLQERTFPTTPGL